MGIVKKSFDRQYAEYEPPQGSNDNVQLIDSIHGPNNGFLEIRAN